MKKMFLILSFFLFLFPVRRILMLLRYRRKAFLSNGIFTKDNSITEYTYIYTNKYAMFRDDIRKVIPAERSGRRGALSFLYCESNCGTGKPCYTIQLDSDRIRFLGVGPSSNKEEVHLNITKGSEVAVVGNPSYFAPPDATDDEGYFWRFYIHQMPDVDGVRTFAIESVGMPGWYISDSPPGFNYAANVVTLQKDKSPESAPKWQGRGVK